MFVSCKKARVASAGLLLVLLSQVAVVYAQTSGRERIKINEGWRFMLYPGEADSLIYDERPVVGYRNDNIVADTRATESGRGSTSSRALKAWILPTANDFIKDPGKRHQCPAGNPGAQFPFVQDSFNDGGWQAVQLPHDWAIKKDFYREAHAIVGGGMGRLPISTWRALRKTGFGCTNPAGGPSCRSHISCHIGTGPTVLVR